MASERDQQQHDGNGRAALALTERSPLAAVERPTGRVPPHDLGAERAVLGGVLLERDAVHVLDDLRASDFYFDRHAHIFGAMRSLVAAASPIDSTTLRERLATAGKLERAGGDEYLLALTDQIPTVDNIEAHTKIVLEKSIVRGIIHACHESAAEGYGDYGDVVDFIERSSARLGLVVDRSLSRTSTVVSIADAVHDEFEILRGRAERGETTLGHLTGFYELDDKLSGFACGDLIIVAGRPGMGKTAFAHGCKMGVARSTKLPVLSFEYEMTREQLVHRAWATEAEINMRLIRGATLGEREFASVAQASERLSRLGLHMCFDRSLTVSGIHRVAKRFAREHGQLGMIVVDYIQRVRTERRGGSSRDSELGEVSNALKNMAGEFGCPVVGLSALNREVEKRTPPIPTMNDLRESGSLEFDADTILLLYREERYKPETPRKGICDIIIGKQRSGPEDTVEIAFRKEYTKFHNLDVRRQEDIDYER